MKWITVDVLAETPPCEQMSESVIGGFCAPISITCGPLNAVVDHTPTGFEEPAQVVTLLVVHETVIFVGEATGAVVSGFPV